MTATKYIYECPVCGKETDSAVGMCKHMTSSTSSIAEHRMWMAEHGIKATYIVGTCIVGTYKPLLEVVEKRCNKYEVEEHKLTVKRLKPQKDKVAFVKGHKPVKNKVVVVKRYKQEERKGVNHEL
jgi:hypothetical protein